MSLSRVLLLALLLSTLALAETPEDPVIAVVNGMPITASEFQAVAARKAPADGKALSEAEREEVLERLVEEKLLYQEALERGLDKDPKVQKVMVNTLLRDDVYSTVNNSEFTDEVLQRYYEAHTSEFVVPEKIQIRYILVAVNDSRTASEARKRAEELRARIVADPERFKDVAAESSDDAYRRRGGDIGFVDRAGKEGLDPKITDVAWTLEVGQISDVFEVERGYGIVMVAARRERVERTFQQMKGSVLRKVKNDKLKELYDGYVADLKKDAKVKVDKRAFKQVEVTPAPRQPLGLGGGGPMIDGVPDSEEDTGGVDP